MTNKEKEKLFKQVNTLKDGQFALCHKNILVEYTMTTFDAKTVI